MALPPFPPPFLPPLPPLPPPVPALAVLLAFAALEEDEAVAGDLRPLVRLDEADGAGEAFPPAAEDDPDPDPPTSPPS